ncbi:hypothetical protein [Agromyces albus]|uniref:DUF4398 domain-containing protein n=1 Tax=Agromyces albus TaxID=205332 RepID=A0A4Q2L829_9MICO|nr:hypothetical protein [Agromyces albus]RXZ72743.1 hypothetical protein ESP51_02780 [Agromyces albus]
MPESRRGRSKRAQALAPLLALTIVLSGCSSPASTFDQAIGQGVAAVETARIAVDQQLDDRIFPTTTITALGDARRELVDASTSVSETDTSTESDAALRTDLLEALALGVTGVNRARDAMGGTGSLEDAVPALERASDALEALEERATEAEGARR